MAKKSRHPAPADTPAEPAAHAETHNSGEPASGFQLPPPNGDTATHAAPVSPQPAVTGSGAPPAAAQPEGIQTNAPAMENTAPPGQTLTTQQLPAPIATINPGGSDTEVRDLAIGFGLVLVVMIAMFFAKNSYANYLVRQRVAPHSANAAGWWLFAAIITLASSAVLAVINFAKFFTPIGSIAFAGIFLLAVVLTIINSRN